MIPYYLNYILFTNSNRYLIIDMFRLFSFRTIMKTPLAPHNLSFASLMNYFGLYVKIMLHK